MNNALISIGEAVHASIPKTAPIMKALCNLGEGAYTKESPQLDAIKGLIEKPCEMESRVFVEGPGFSISGMVNADGTFEIQGVPPGAWTVKASSCVFVNGHQHSSGSAEIKGDEPLTIRMSAPRVRQKRCV